MSPLSGPVARITRAESQLIFLNETSQGFFKEHTYSTRTKFNKKTRCYDFRIKCCPPPFPIEWSVVIGEIAHNLRSALDGLAWQLALKNKSIPYHLTAFPICILREGTRAKLGGGNYHGFWHNWSKKIPIHCLKDINRRYWKRIEAFQPYKRENGGLKSPLFLLEELNNTDKHRLITVLAANMSGWRSTGLSGQITVKYGVSLKPDAKVATALPLPREGVLVLDIITERFVRKHEVDVNTHITPEIRFGSSCRAVKGLPVILTLKRILDKVSHIIESFAKDF